MSHQQRKLSEALRQASYLKVTLKSETPKSEYCRGVYNGFEIINSLLLNKEPELVLNESRDLEIETHLSIEKNLNTLVQNRDDEIIKLRKERDKKDKLIENLTHFISSINKTMDEEKINLGMMENVRSIGLEMNKLIDEYHDEEPNNHKSGDRVIWLKNNTIVEFLHDAPDVAINHAKTCHIRTESGEGFYVPYEAIKKIY